MADQPAFFTVAPWGYRILTPWLVHALPVRNVVRGFRLVTFGGLGAAGFLLYLFCRRLGHAMVPSLLASSVFLLSAPVGEVVRHPFLSEPLGVALMIAFLVALEAGAGVGVLAALAAAGALTKDASLFVLLTPAVYLARQKPGGRRSAAVVATVAAVAALLAAGILRAWWTPGLVAQHPALGLDLVRSGVAVLGETWPETARAILLGGLTPLALLAAFRAAARPHLRRYGYLAAATLALPFVAWVQVPSPTPVPLFGRNVLRLLIYALPLLLPLALTLLESPWPLRPPRPRASWPPAVEVAGAVIAVACLSFPVLALDRYRRVDLQGPRDGPLILALCRETLRTASRLERGLTVTFDPESRQFVWGVSDPGQLDRMRWFLRRGWGALAHYGTGNVTMHEATASILVPCLRARDLEVTLALDAPAPAEVAIDMNGVGLARYGVGTAPTDVVVPVPANVLFRGDNLLTLTRRPASAPGPRLRRISLRARVDGEMEEAR